MAEAYKLDPRSVRIAAQILDHVPMRIERRADSRAHMPSKPRAAEVETKRGDIFVVLVNLVEALL